MSAWPPAAASSTTSMDQIDDSPPADHRRRDRGPDHPVTSDAGPLRRVRAPADPTAGRLRPARRRSTRRRLGPPGARPAVRHHAATPCRRVARPEAAIDRGTDGTSGRGLTPWPVPTGGGPPWPKREAPGTAGRARGRRQPLRRRAARHHQALPRRGRQPRHRAPGRPRRGPRDRGRERRRQVDADEDALRRCTARTRARSCWTGARCNFRSPADAIAAGIGMVHQHFMLADNFTVLENIVLGSEPTKGGRLDRAEARRRIARDLRPLRPRPRPRRARRGPRRR